MLKKSLKYMILPLLFCCFVCSNFALADDDFHLLNPEDDCITSGNCEISDINYTIKRVSELILGIVGSLALLAFIAGGIMLLISGGNKNWVERGRATLLGAAIGLAVVFLSYTIVGLVFQSMGIEKDWFRSNWF